MARNTRNDYRGTQRAVYTLLLAGPMLLAVPLLAVDVCIIRTSAPIWADGCILGYVDAIHTGRLYCRDALLHEPYLVLAHPPLSYCLAWLFSHLAPLQFWPLRLLTLLAVLATACAVGAIAYRQSGHQIRPAIFAGCVFLLLPPVLAQSHLARSVDALAAGFSAGALLALLRLRPGFRRDVTVGLLLSGAALSKQPALATLGLTLMVWFIVRREWRAAARTFSVTTAVLILVSAGLQWHTQGGFLRNVVAANVMPMSWANWRYVAVDGLWPLWIYALILLAVGGVRPTLGTIYLCASVMVGSVACARMGSWMIYFTDAATALALLSGEVFARLEKQPSVRWTQPVVILLALAVAVVPGLPYLTGTRSFHASQYARMLAFLRSTLPTAGPLLSDDPGVALQLGQIPVWNDAFIFGQNARDGRWDCTPLAERLARGEFGAVVTIGQAALWPPAMRRALAARYAPVQRYAYMGAAETYTVYLRVGLDDPVQPVED